MNIKDLENFYNISSFKSFSLASKMLGVTQPTLSESVKRLEKNLDTILFYRSKSGITLTPQGENILIKVKDLLNIKNEIETSSNSQKDFFQNYRIGCHPVVGRYFLNDFFQGLHKNFSNVTVNLSHDHSREVQRLIQNGKIDIGIVVNPIRNPDLIIKKLCDDKICIWQSAKGKLKEDQLIADLELSQVQSILRSWNKAPSRYISSTDFNIIGELTSAGMGYGILPKRFVEMQKLKLKQVHTSIFFKDEISLLFRPEFGKNKVERFIIDSITSCFN